MRRIFSAAANPSALSRLPSRMAAASAGVLISRAGNSAPSAISRSRPSSKSWSKTPGGKIVRHDREARLLEIFREQANHLGGAGFALRPELSRARVRL